MDKILLITGASRGIGAATALRAAAAGYKVCINYAHSEAAALNLVNQINANGGTAIAVQADVSKEEDVIRLFGTIDTKLGPITALVNNAGILETQQRVEEMTLDRLQRVYAVNVFGSFLCARESIKRMSTRHGGQGGAIVNVSSAASRHGSPNEYVDYAASKAAIDTFTIGLAKEVANENIRVNAVRPGLIYTEIHASGGVPNRVDLLADSVPMKRGGYPEEVANTVLWLLSEEASYVTGGILDVSGGR